MSQPLLVPIPLSYRDMPGPSLSVDVFVKKNQLGRHSFETIVIVVIVVVVVVDVVVAVAAAVDIGAVVAAVVVVASVVVVVAVMAVGCHHRCRRRCRHPRGCSRQNTKA